MPCIFCIAAFMLIAGAVSAGAIEKIENDLAQLAQGPLRKLAETESVMKWELDTKVGRRSVPVAVSVFKDHARVRIQILTHELPREEAEKVEDEVAEALGAKILSRSDPEEAHKVQEAEVEAPQAEVERLPAQRTDPGKVNPTKRSENR